MRSSFLASVSVIEFHTVEAHSSLGLTIVRYNISRLSRVDKEKVGRNNNNNNNNTIITPKEVSHPSR
jgi:hypothetical protein